MEKFDQAWCEHGNIVFENNRRNSIRTIRLPRVKASEGTKNIITKDSNIRHEVVSVWWRRRNKTRIIQCGVVSKSLSEKFSLRDRGDGSGAIWVK